jgi:hypothetical protein
LSQLLSDERRSTFNATLNNLLLNKEFQNLVAATSNTLAQGSTTSSNSSSANVITRLAQFNKSSCSNLVDAVLASELVKHSKNKTKASVSDSRSNTSDEDDDTEYSLEQSCIILD